MVGTAGIVEIYSVSWCPLNVTCDFSDYLSRSFSSSVSRCQRKCQKGIKVSVHTHDIGLDI